MPRHRSKLRWADGWGIAALALLAACSVSARPQVLPAGDPAIVRVGPFDTRDPRAPRFAWPGTELRLAFRASSISIELTDTPHEDETRETDWLAVQIDDQVPTAVALREGRHRYRLASGLARTSHTLRITKRTEAEVGTITLHGFEVDPRGAFLAPPARKKRRIAFIGDSISAGYGNEGASSDCRWSAALEDASRAFPKVAADLLDAEAFVTAWSGKGVYQNYDARDLRPMPQLFYLAIPTDERPVGLPTRPRPHAVVIALGSNDFAREKPARASFVAAYRNLLAMVRARASGAPVFSMVSPTLTENHPHAGARSTLIRWLTQLESEERAAGRSLTVVEQRAVRAEGQGCDFHPNVVTHARLGRELAEVIREQLGW